MHKRFSAFAKRALAFTLAMVLIVALVPMNAMAEEVVGNWTYKDGYSWIGGSFDTDVADNTYQDSQVYDWRVIMFPTKSPPASAQVVASIADASGKTISSYTGTVSGMAQRVETVLCSYENFPELTNKLYGTFTLTCELKLSGTTYAKLVQTFRRVSSNPFDVSVSSRSNPDNVFTFADPIDLVLNIKKNDGIAMAYNAAITVTNGSANELLAARGVSLPASTNITLSLKDLLEVPTLTTAGTYQVNLTLADSKGTIQYQDSYDFGVVALKDNLTTTISSESGSGTTFNNMVPDLVVNLNKADGIAEALNTAITVKNSYGDIVYSGNFETNSANAVVTPDLSGLSATGTFTMTAVVTDDAGNSRGSASVTFKRTNNVPLTYEITDNSAEVTGNIFSADFDFSLSFKIIHKASAGQVMQVKAVGTLNGKPFESPAKKATLSSYSGIATVTINGAALGSYGIFEDISLVVYNSDGVQVCQTTETYSFARVLDTSNPGDLPLLNVNDHFTTKKGDASLKISLAAQTGANMWRASIPWASVEKSKGSYNMPGDVKIVMDQTKSNGMQALILLAYGNDEIYGTPNPTDSTWLNAYANYCYYVASQMAQFYPNQVVAFEIWNEWNHATMSKVPATYRTGAHYATVVKAASQQIRAVNAKYGTNFKVIAGATAGDGYSGTSTDFIKAMMSASGFFEAVDGVSFHTYSSEETTTIYDQLKDQRKFEYISPAEHDFAARISNYNNLVQTYNKTGKDVEIWITETGWTTNEEPESATGSTDGKTHITYGVTEEEGAAYLVQLYAWALYEGSVDRIFWYDFMNDISNQTGKWGNNLTESNYGLIHNWNNGDGEPLAYSAKLGYVTMCALSSKLGGATNGTKINLGSNIYAYQFNKDGKLITVIWSEGGNKTINLNLSKDISVSDMYGNATTYSAGSATLTISTNPIYLEYTSGSISFG